MGGKKAVGPNAPHEILVAVVNLTFSQFLEAPRAGPTGQLYSALDITLLYLGETKND